MKHALSILTLSLAATAAHGGPACSGDPEEKVQQVFRALENRSRDEATLRQIYAQDFSTQFKKSIAFDEFARSLRELQRRLEIGSLNNRSWESRNLQEPIIEQMADDQFHIALVTTSPVGKIVQRAYVVCEQNAWVLSGLWYFPLGSAQAPK